MLLQPVDKNVLLRRALHLSSSLRSGGCPWRGPAFAAGREWVGPGYSNEPTYTDRFDYWWPALRFQKENEHFKKLREKEKGDWKKLTIDEKKQLYRFNYCQTLAEVEAHEYLYWQLSWIGLFILGFLTNMHEWFTERYCEEDLSRTLTDEWKEKWLENQLVLMSEPITGWSAKWDYERGRWRKTFFSFNLD